MDRYYTMEIAGVSRDLPLCKLNDSMYIAGFIMFGDVELTVKSAEALLKLAPEYDVLVTAEAKGIPLLYEMARQSGNNYYVIARKAPKLYMRDILKVDVDSITTEHKQTLYLDGSDVDKIKGKRILIVDDVISTGNSLKAIETLIEKAGGNIVGKMTVLAEGDAIGREDITYLAPLPLFDSEGNPL